MDPAAQGGTVSIDVSLDGALPNGARPDLNIDGTIQLERLKNIASLGCTPVIVVSARDPKANEKRALDAGAEAFFQKPVDNAQLMSAIHTALMK